MDGSVDSRYLVWFGVVMLAILGFGLFLFIRMRRGAMGQSENGHDMTNTNVVEKPFVGERFAPQGSTCLFEVLLEVFRVDEVNATIDCVAAMKLPGPLICSTALHYYTLYDYGVMGWSFTYGKPEDSHSSAWMWDPENFVYKGYKINVIDCMTMTA